MGAFCARGTGRERRRGGGGRDGVLSFLRKRKVPKENLFGEKLRFSKKGGMVEMGLGHGGSAFTKPTLPWGAWKGLGGGKESDVSTDYSLTEGRGKGDALLKPSPGRGRGTVEDG